MSPRPVRGQSFNWLCMWLFQLQQGAQKITRMNECDRLPVHIERLRRADA